MLIVKTNSANVLAEAPSMGKLHTYVPSVNEFKREDFPSPQFVYPSGDGLKTLKIEKDKFYVTSPNGILDLPSEKAVVFDGDAIRIEDAANYAKEVFSSQIVNLKPGSKITFGPLLASDREKVYRLLRKNKFTFVTNQKTNIKFSNGQVERGFEVASVLYVSDWSAEEITFRKANFQGTFRNQMGHFWKNIITNMMLPGEEIHIPADVVYSLRYARGSLVMLVYSFNKNREEHGFSCHLSQRMGEPYKITKQIAPEEIRRLIEKYKKDLEWKVIAQYKGFQ